MNITWHESQVNKEDRQRLHGHKSFVLWFTGLSGSGKSTLCGEVEKILYEEGISTYILDGDNIRHGINKNLGFSQADRAENIRRIGEIAKLFVDAGVVVLAAFISPYQEDRDKVRQLFSADEFIEVYVKCSLSACEGRDPKGLYEKARAGEIKEFTGISAPYEAPIYPEITVNNEEQTVKESTQQIMDYIREKIHLSEES